MEYTTQLHWQRGTAEFTTKGYSRNHEIRFNGGITIEGSAAPEFFGNSALANPEELFIASISSCFMLTFLYWAAMKNIVINSYSATATGTLAKNAEGKMSVTQVLIKPQIQFDNQAPESSVIEDIIKKAHENCFISNSVKSTIRIEL